jgi:hypothetical protein
MSDLLLSESMMGGRVTLGGRETTALYAYEENRYSYDDAGGDTTRPLVICVHGMALGSFYFAEIAAKLGEAGFRVLRYDTLGMASLRCVIVYVRGSNNFLRWV